MLEIINTNPSHLRELAKNIREEDKKEVLALGMSPEKALWTSYKNSIYRKTALINGKTAACWGVCGNMFGESGEPWLLTSYEVLKVSPLLFARIYKHEVEIMLEYFPVLANHCDARYSKAIKLLKIIGFKVEEPASLRNGVFCRFEIRR